MSAVTLIKLPPEIDGAAWPLTIGTIGYIIEESLPDGLTAVLLPCGVIALKRGEHFADGIGRSTNTVADISDAELLRRAVRAARDRDHRKGYKHPRWVAVMDAFSLGSTFARQLCRRLDLNPDEMVSR